MASWNEKDKGDQLESCSICLAKLAKKRATNHQNNCLKRHQDKLEDMGLIVCPLYKHHIIPRKFLNHHLEGNCEEAANMLRKFFQKAPDFQAPPEHFLSDVPKDILNEHNRRLLFILGRNLDGSIYHANSVDRICAQDVD